VKTSSNANPRAPRVDTIARVLSPRKTAAELPSPAGRSERTCNYWLSGKFEPSAAALVAVIAESLPA
jgi:hypothetical protein